MLQGGGGLLEGPLGKDSARKFALDSYAHSRSGRLPPPRYDISFWFQFLARMT